MALSASGLFVLTFKDILGNDTAVDVLADSIKVALFTNSLTTPNFSTNTAYAAAPFNANEVGTPSGGVAITSPTLTATTGDVLTFDGADTAWSSQSFTAARGGLLYDDTISTPVSKPAICLVAFGADYSVTSCVFTIQWNASGIWYLDLA